MPGEADVLPQNAFMKIADVAAVRQCRHRLGPEVRAVARRESEAPHLVWSKTDARADRGMIESDLGRIP